MSDEVEYVGPAEVTRVDEHTVIVTDLFHESAEPLPDELVAKESPWGHGGMFFWRCLIDQSQPHVYVFHGPFRLYFVNVFDLGSWHIQMGFGNDEDFNGILRELGPHAGLPTTGPPWPLPSKTYAIDYLRELHAMLREYLDARSYDGFWAGGEIVVWNFGKLKQRRML